MIMFDFVYVFNEEEYNVLGSLHYVFIKKLESLVIKDCCEEGC